jgi:hypothetical protein
MLTASFFRRGLIAAILALGVDGAVLAQSGGSQLPPLPSGRRPKMPPKPPILGIPNGGRDGRWQEGHGAYGNTQGSASGQAAGQAGQFGQQGGGLGGNVNGFGTGGAFGGAGGGLAAFGQFGNGGGFAGGLLGGIKGFSVGGGLLGPEIHYRDGVGLYGGKPSLDGGVSDREAVRAHATSAGYHALMLSPVVIEALQAKR